MASLNDGIFSEFKNCEFCHKPLPNAYDKPLCPSCIEAQLFREVKNFIRENTVNEYEVADHFQIPLRVVKEWIREGRIEYVTNAQGGTMASVHCQRCGAPVQFGTLCPKCLKLLNHNIKGYEVQELNRNHKMRFVDQQED